MAITILQGDCRDCMRTLPEKSVHAVVTSPPYWGLRDYGNDGQIGLEKTPQDYVAAIVSVFAELWRVLRDDGVAWLNLGDSYAHDSPSGPQGKSGGRASRTFTANGAGGYRHGLKPKDLVGIPWRVAFALQDAGWHLRSDCVWNKTNPMPESVTDRPTKSHEYVFLLTKQPRYFYDAVAVATPHSREWWFETVGEKYMTKADGRNDGGKREGNGNPTGANLRSVWTISTKPCKLAHFAVMPPDLAETCIKSATSEHGCCPVCGAPWRRIVEKDRKPTRPGVNVKYLPKSDGDLQSANTLGWTNPQVIGNRDPQRHCTTTITTGWQPTCKCDRADVVPCTVLDPFGGAGTTGLVADRLGRHAILCELNPKYVAICRKRLHEDAPLLSNIQVRECA